MEITNPATLSPFLSKGAFYCQLQLHWGFGAQSCFLILVASWYLTAQRLLRQEIRALLMTTLE